MRRRPGPRRGPIDWADARRRLAEALVRTEQAGAPDDAAARAAMDERARRLAQPLEEPAAGARLELLTFSLGSERYGVETRFVREVVRLDELSAVPGAPEHLLGAVPYRGEVLPVFDLRRVLGTFREGLFDLGRVIVLGAGRAELGVIADAADDVREVPADALLPLGAAAAADLLRGATPALVLVLDAERLLADPRFFIEQPP